MNALVWDCGLGVDHAVALSKHFDRVEYFTPYVTMGGTPFWKDYAIGYGMEGLTPCLDFWESVGKLDRDEDCIFFLDIGEAGATDFLRKQGYNVFGAGKAEWLEKDRIRLMHWRRKMGLPVESFSVVPDVESLESKLKDKDNQVVKLNIFRGTQETFISRNYDASQGLVNRLKHNIGPFKFDFLITDTIDAVCEAGIDAFFSNGKFQFPAVCGYENGEPYIGTFIDKYPDNLQKTADLLQKELQKADYRGFFSTEERIKANGKGYLIDCTCRPPYPLSLIYTEALENYGFVMESMARNEDISPQPKGAVVGALPLFCERSDIWLPIDFPSGLRDKIKLQFAAKKGSQYYVAPNTEMPVTIVEYGESVDEVIESLCEIAKEVDAPGLKHDSIHRLKEITETIENGMKYGLVDIE